MNSKILEETIEELVKEEGDSVTIYCGNPDYTGPERIIDCCGDWTNWKEKRFEGDLLVDCLDAALKEKNECL